MSLGVGVGDVLLVSKLAWNLYKSYKDASDDFKEVSLDLMSLHAVLRETEDYLQEHSDLAQSRLNRLQMLCDGCKPVLAELEALHAKYDNLGTQAQRAWGRFRFGMKDLSDLRSRLVSSTTMLNAFNIALINSSTARIERRLNKFMTEVQAGLREGSVVTVDNAAEAIDSPEVWTEFRRELEDVGISAHVVEENREYIAKWIKDALQEGLLEESVTDSESERRPSIFSTTSNTSSVPGSVTTFADSGYSGSISSRKPSTVTLCTANEEFEQQLSRVNTIIPSRTPTKPVTVRPKKRMDVSRLVQRMMVKDKAIVEAASDGKLERVAELIGLGVNVNARDVWGWSALSMCGYGGYGDIARLLLDHGADLDNIDVDGDTPMSLAATRGHTELVVIFDEARAMRDLRLRQADNEPPKG
ncbi:hypothetical protein B0I35DRAFT_516059 [Stachybotrys elegans]|uniref:Fungal N-terminal domain-containing protein n=1 Tax=Stachybotrys elegans TaxID=80388 RepID=A0A8K0SKL1_9HYPO|nr:hypothetical protein B0I35DRAFT_516059 [Stachybotrys elegans]